MKWELCLLFDTVENKEICKNGIWLPIIVDRLDICIVVDVFWKLLDNSIDLNDELKVTNCLLIDDGIEAEGTRWPSSLNAEELLWNVGQFEIVEFLNDRLERQKVSEMPPISTQYILCIQSLHKLIMIIQDR